MFNAYVAYTGINDAIFTINLQRNENLAL